MVIGSRTWLSHLARMASTTNILPYQLHGNIRLDEPLEMFLYFIHPKKIEIGLIQISNNKNSGL